MFCTKCGHLIPEGEDMCPHCGFKSTDPIPEQNQKRNSIPLPNPIPENGDKSAQKQKKIMRILLIIITAAVALLLIFAAVSEADKANLRKTITKDWYQAGDSIIKVLDFDDDEIDYRVETGYSWLDTTIARYDWEPVSGSQIRVRRSSNSRGTVYTVNFSNNGNTMRITPALTNTDYSETWYHINLD